MARFWFPPLLTNARTDHRNRKPHRPVGGNTGRNTTIIRSRIAVRHSFADRVWHLLAGIGREIELGI